MNRKRELFLASILIFVLLWTSCSFGFNSSQSKNYEISPMATPVVSSSDGNIKRFINEAGWHVPVPPRLKKGPKDTLHFKSVDGKEILVTATTMIGFGEYNFTQDSRDLVQDGYPDLGEMRLVAFKGLSVGNKVFSYVIVAESTKKDASHTAGNNHPSRPLYYKILDNDGDGKFETLFPGNSDQLVPNWVVN